MPDWTARGGPLHATANGKVLLAFGDGDPPRELARLTPRTITDRAALRAELDDVRRRGFATAVEELEVGLHAAAAPVFDSLAVCIAAVSLSGPSYRLADVEAAGRACVETADEISRSIGFRRAA